VTQQDCHPTCAQTAIAGDHGRPGASGHGPSGRTKHRRATPASGCVIRSSHRTREYPRVHGQYPARRAPRVLYLDSRRPAAFSKLDRQILDALAADAADILDNARLVERERERSAWSRRSISPATSSKGFSRAISANTASLRHGFNLPCCGWRRLLRCLPLSVTVRRFLSRTFGRAWRRDCHHHASGALSG